MTIPHKEAALELAEVLTGRARAIGAANTLLFEPDGTIRADNTDGPALIDALPFPIGGRSALVLGAGGSARAAVWALREAGADRVGVWNRTPERARELAAALGAEPVARIADADVLVNCTSIGLDADHDLFKQVGVAADVLTRFSCVVDFVYAATETRLIQAAQSRSVPVVDGLELLVRQGALSFAQFTGRPAPLAVMRAAARG